jgi:dipeptidyl aminopeptidase/acylaminoacyl peptidase
MVRELIEQGYIIVAPEYRGSTGYGLIFFHSIDEYLLPEDTYACRNWMLENCEQIDSDRIGIMGHSHGGYNTLFNVFRHPKAYHAAYAGVPMSDMFIRLNYHLGFYDARERHSDGRIGDQWAIRDRSPAWNVEGLETPLLIHAATNDRDVFITEVESLIVHLKAAGKEFEYKAYEDAPGGHSFEYIDTAFAKAARREAYKFLARYLKPENPP